MKDVVEREKEEDYKFTAIIYPDAENYSCEHILNHVLPESGFFAVYYYILHDRDFNLDGSPKKPHYHIVIDKHFPSRLGIVAKQLGIPSNYVERCKSLKNMVCYLTHDENLDKTTYSKDEIITNAPDNINKFFKVDTDNQMGAEILNYIVNNNVTSIRELSIWAINSGYYSAFRRGFAVFSSVVKEQAKWQGRAE